MRNKKGKKHKKRAFKLVIRDMSFALIGLVISVILAIAVNPLIRKDLLNYISRLF